LLQFLTLDSGRNPPFFYFFMLAKQSGMMRAYQLPGEDTRD
jgi:hypothetical protein